MAQKFRVDETEQKIALKLDTDTSVLGSGDEIVSTDGNTITVNKNISLGSSTIGSGAITSTGAVTGTAFNLTAGVDVNGFIGVGALTPDVSSGPDLTTPTNFVPCWSFDADTDEHLYGSFRLPSNYEAGTVLAYTLFYSPSTTNTGDAVLALDRLLFASGDTVATSNQGTSTDTQSGTANLVRNATFFESGTGLVAGDIVSLRISRDANNVADTFTGEIQVYGISITHKIDGLT